MSRLNQEEINNSNRPITSSKIEFEIKKKKKHNKQTPGVDGFIEGFYREDPVLLQLFQKVKRMGHSQFHSVWLQLPPYQNQKKSLKKQKL